MNEPIPCTITVEDLDKSIELSRGEGQHTPENCVVAVAMSRVIGKRIDRMAYTFGCVCGIMYDIEGEDTYYKVILAYDNRMYEECRLLLPIDIQLIKR